MQQLTPLPQILNQQKIRPTPLIVQIVCVVKDKDAIDINERNYWIRVSDSHAIMNFACKKKLNKYVVNFKTGDIVQFGESSWKVLKISDELCFKIVTKDFHVLAHDRLRTPKKFWGAGPVPNGMHRQISEDLSNVSDDEDNNNDLNVQKSENKDDSSSFSSSNEADQQINDAGFDEEKENDQQMKSNKRTPTKRSHSDEGDRNNKRARNGGFGPSTINMEEASVASTRYAFYEYEGTITSKQWQTYGAVMIKSSRDVLAKNHQYKTESGLEVCIAAISRGNNGVITIHATETGQSLLRFKPNDFVAYIGTGSRMMIDQAAALWNSILPDEQQTPVQTRTTPRSPYQPPPLEQSSPSFDNSKNEAKFTELQLNFDKLQRNYNRLEAEIKASTAKVAELEESKDQMLKMMATIRECNELNFKKLKKKLKKNTEQLPPMNMPMPYGNPYVMPPTGYPMPMMPHGSHHYAPRFN